MSWQHCYENNFPANSFGNQLALILLKLVIEFENLVCNMSSRKPYFLLLDEYDDVTVVQSDQVNITDKYFLWPPYKDIGRCNKAVENRDPPNNK